MMKSRKYLLRNSVAKVTSELILHQAGSISLGSIRITMEVMFSRAHYPWEITLLPEKEMIISSDGSI